MRVVNSPAHTFSLSKLPNRRLLKIRVFVVVALLSGLTSATQRRARTPSSLGRDYPSALAAADRFLHAWQARDEETGLLMLSEEAKQHASEDALEDFFSSGADAAYEIGRGKQLNSGRYSFPVTLYLTPSDKNRRPRYSTLIVVRTGKDDWAIERVP